VFAQEVGVESEETMELAASLESMKAKHRVRVEAEAPMEAEVEETAENERADTPPVEVEAPMEEAEIPSAEDQDFPPVEDAEEEDDILQEETEAPMEEETVTVTPVEDDPIPKEISELIRDDLEGMVDAYVKANRKFQQAGLRAEATRQVLLWNDTRCIHSIRRLSGTGECQARMWNSAGVLEEVELSEQYVKFLLSSSAFKKERFRSDTFVSLQDYDRQQTVDGATFQSVTKSSAFEFTMKDSDGKAVNVPRRWVVNNVDRQSWREAEKKGCGYRVKIPEGAAPPPGQLRMIPVAGQLPMMEYTNKSNQCLILSCTSALHYLGHTVEAWTIVNELNNSRDRQHHNFEFDRLRPLITDRFERMKIRRWKYEPSDRSHRSPNPIVASLCAKRMENGKTRRELINHCVCFVGDYIFDSNRTTALPNTALSLDLICNFRDGLSYGGILWSRELVLNK
jgi:hypothetical protein